MKSLVLKRRPPKEVAEENFFMEDVATMPADVPDPRLPVKVDVDLMKQAFLNVVINGVQAMPQGGVLTVSARRESAQVIVEIQDQGGGIPQDMHEKIFELYFTTKKEGSGIGLAQTYQILQWHYGSVDFESAETTGTIFRFQIPLAGTVAETAQDYTTDETTSQRGD